MLGNYYKIIIRGREGASSTDHLFLFDHYQLVHEVLADRLRPVNYIRTDDQRIGVGLEDRALSRQSAGGYIANMVSYIATLVSYIATLSRVI